MPNSILIKRSSVAAKAPVATDLQLGELAINTTDGKLFLKKNNGTDSIVEVGAVTSVASRTGAVILTGTDVGLALVENKSSATIRNEITSSNVTTSLGFTPISTAAQGAVNGVATLDSTGKIVTSQLPAITITDTFVVASQAAMLALVAQTGDVAVRTDLNKSFIVKGADGTVIGNWQELLTPTDVVLSVAGRTGAIVLGATDITTALTFTPVNKAGDTITGALTVNNTITAKNQLITGSIGTGTGGQLGINDDAGAFRWAVGLLGQAGARDFSIYDNTNAASRITINSTSGLVSVANSLSVVGSVTGASFSGSGSGLTGNAASLNIGGASYSTRVVSSPDGDRTQGIAPNTLSRSVTYDFKNAAVLEGTIGNYVGLMSYSPWDGLSASTGDCSYQLAFASTIANGGKPRLAIRNGIDTTWNSWNEIYHSGNSTPANVNPTAAKAGDISVSAGIISIHDGTSFKQVFPAVYA